jgi:uncharacterized protein YcbK (DUF882 family)
LTKAFRNLGKSSAYVAFAIGLLGFAGCTASSGPDVAVASYGIAAPDLAAPTQLSSAGEAAPDQAPGVTVGVNAGGVDSVGVKAGANLEASVSGSTEEVAQAFVPGGVPPSATIPTSLASETTISAGAAANSGDYVTEGVERKIEKSAAEPAPLTPSDVAGQVPAPVAAPAAEASELDVSGKQVVSLEVGDGEADGAQNVPSPAAAKTSRPKAAAKPTLFGNLFSNSQKPPKQSLTASPDSNDGNVQLASLETSDDDNTQQSESLNSLPGVNTKNLFALDPTLNASDEPFDDQPEVQVASASAAGLARLAPNGLLKQTEQVDVSCFKPQLISVLRKIEGHYGKKLIVTSGYRSPKGNRRAGGSRNSLHISCAAADIQIAGVGKWQLAKYLRSMPGRGGVGTYCHTDSVHIDVGSERDWNWRCRRR